MKRRQAGYKCRQAIKPYHSGPNPYPTKLSRCLYDLLFPSQTSLSVLLFHLLPPPLCLLFLASQSENSHTKEMGEEEAATNPPPSPLPSLPPLPGCDFCSEAAAVVYCQADSARLCLRCDRHVHAANSVSSRHHRALLCDACHAAPAAILCSSSSAHRGLLCSNCDFDAHPTGSGLHDRRPVDLFTACPSVLDLAAVLGVGFDEKPARAGEESTGDDDGFPDDMWLWETTPVFSLQDLIVPTTSQHNFQAMGMPPLPKNWNSACGKHRDEVIRQLNELIKSETDEGNDGGDHKQVVELSSLLPEHNFEEGNLGSDYDHDPACPDMPSLEVNDLGWNFSDFQEKNDSTVFSYEQLMGSSSAANASFPDARTDSHPNPSHGIRDGKDQAYPVIEEKLPSLPSKGGVELCPDRESVISRYKEKRKARRYDKQIRYESRKARADTRMRIKGRFAKVSQTAADSRLG